MRFCEQLNEYITRLDCRGKELADGAGLSAPTLSRYRTGERTPSRDSTALPPSAPRCPRWRGKRAWRTWMRTRCRKRSSDATSSPGRTNGCCGRTSTPS